MTTIASATPGASRVPKAEVTGKLAAGWLTAAAVLADLGLGAGVAGDLLYGSGANTLARLPIATAGRVLVAGASAPAWSDSGLSYASGVLTVAGSVPGTPSSGQVAIGGGAIKAGGVISTTSTLVSKTVLASNSITTPGGIAAGSGFIAISDTTDTVSYGIRQLSGRFSDTRATNGTRYQRIIESQIWPAVNSGVTDGGYVIGTVTDLLRNSTGANQTDDNGTLASLIGLWYTIGHGSTNAVSPQTTSVTGQSFLLFGSTGYIGTLTGIDLGTTIAANANVGTFYGIKIGASKSTTASYGLWINNQVSAASAYSIYTGTGIVRFGDSTAATTTSDGAFRLAGGLSSLGGAVFAGTITAGNGTAAAPSFRTTTYAHGFYSVAASAMGFAVGGVSAATLYKPSGTTYGGALSLTTPTPGEGGLVFASSSNSFVSYSGGSTVDVGAWVRAYGQSHGTKPNYLEFGYTTTVAAFFNGSGVLTINNTTDATTLTAASMLLNGGLATAAGKSILSGGKILSLGATHGIGYGAGAGGTVTQGTSRTTGVTLNTVTGRIALFTAAGSATPTTFTVTCSACAETDTVIVTDWSGAANTYIWKAKAANGSFDVTFWTTGGTASDAPGIHFNIIKGAIS